MSIDRSNTVLQYNQSFVVNGYQLSGVDNVQINHSSPLENALVLGTDFGFNLNNPFTAEVSMDRSLLYIDPMLSFTGDSSFSGSFLYNGQNYSFTSGFLNRYSIDCSVGDIPKISCSISIYGELKQTFDTPTIISHPSIFIPSPRSISVSGDDTNTNRVKSFSYELNINRQPIYSLDSAKDIDDVIFIPPINVSASLVIDAYDFTPDNYKDFLSSTDKKTFNVIVNDRASSTELINLNVPNIQLISQNLTATSENSLTITNNYLGYIR